jgi:UDP-3-O-[3-hydroxymyristoyl] glucosamine N-acyltransferase
MNRFGLADIEHILVEDYEIVGNTDRAAFTKVRSIRDADEETLVWANPLRADKQSLIESTRARVVVCDPQVELTPSLLRDKCFVVVSSPKIAFSRIVDALFGKERRWGVHPSAVVEPDAVIHTPVYVGPHSYIGAAEIGERTVIHGNCHVYDGVTIGRSVVVHAGTVIGSDGFGYEPDDAGRLVKFPHVGGVVIEDGVEIGSATVIDRGSLDDTTIRARAKIDNLVHVAHSVEVGEDSLVIAHVMLGGSVKVGRGCWLGPGSIFRDNISIGDGAFVGIGSLVTKDVEAGATVMGSPARHAEEYKALLRSLRNLAAGVTA